MRSEVKILDPKLPPNPTIDSLEVGAMFTYAAKRVVYMKVRTLHAGFQVIALDTGESYSPDFSKEIIPVKEISIKR